MANLRIPEGQLIKAEFFPMKKLMPEEQFVKIASKGEPVKYYEWEIKRPKWWKKTVSERVVKESSTEQYSENMYVLPTDINFKWEPHNLHSESKIRNIYHYIEVNGEWYKAPYIYYQVKTVGGTNGYYLYFSDDKEAFDNFEMFEELGLPIPLPFDEV